jgi:hypothetical protein
MLPNLFEFGPTAFFYLLALAATIGGWTSQFVAFGLVIVGTLWLAGSLVYRWHLKRIRAGKRGLEPSYLILFGLVGAAACLLVAAGGYVWQLRSLPVSSAAAPAPETVTHFGIAWNFDDPSREGVYFLSITKQPGEETTVANFQASGVNSSADPMTCEAAYVVSDLTGDRVPVLFYIENERVPVDQVRPIPPGAEFVVFSERFSTLFKGLAERANASQQVPISRFLAEFGAFSFVFECNPGTYRRRFSVQDIRNLVGKLEASTIPKPRVSKKPAQ